MKRMIIALATAAGLSLSVGVASADPGGFAPPIGGTSGAVSQLGGPGTFLGAGELPPGRGPDRYGCAPCIKKLFKLGHHANNCGPNTGYHHNPLQNPAHWGAGGYGMGGPAYNPQGFPPGAFGPVMQGTLVFPHHTFVRSPRDFFMMDLNK
jgi:hypothetical protein